MRTQARLALAGALGSGVGGLAATSPHAGVGRVDGRRRLTRPRVRAPVRRPRPTLRSRRSITRQRGPARDRERGRRERRRVDLRLRGAERRRRRCCVAYDLDETIDQPRARSATARPTDFCFEPSGAGPHRCRPVVGPGHATSMLRRTPDGRVRRHGHRRHRRDGHRRSPACARDADGREPARDAARRRVRRGLRLRHVGAGTAATVIGLRGHPVGRAQRPGSAPGEDPVPARRSAPPARR